MPRKHSIVANGHAFSARTGEIILDAALASGVTIPHDCRAGRYGTCLARVAKGVTLGGHAPQRSAIYACQARALADLELQFEVPPPVTSVPARVMSLLADRRMSSNSVCNWRARWRYGPDNIARTSSRGSRPGTSVRPDPQMVRRREPT
jgi:ferredoxin